MILESESSHNPTCMHAFLQRSAAPYVNKHVGAELKRPRSASKIITPSFTLTFEKGTQTSPDLQLTMHIRSRAMDVEIKRKQLKNFILKQTGRKKQYIPRQDHG